MVDPLAIEAALRPETVLVSVMWANNEIGTIEPIADIGRLLLAWRKAHATPCPYFHSDACQAAGACDLNVEKSHVDALTINGSKIYGPKGVGLLYVRRGVKLEPLARGGGQERNLRPGTENVPGIMGLACAFEIAQAERDEENARLSMLRDRLIEGLLAIPKSRLNGHPTERLPNNVNISFLDIEGEAAALYLDAEGVQVSTGSACASTSLDPSHVILATGLSYEAAHGSLRYTLGHSTTLDDVDLVIRVMPGIVERLRRMSPVNLDMNYFTYEHQR
jgi:cysteine desulfurase